MNRIYLFSILGLMMSGFAQARISKIAIQKGPYRVEVGKCSPPLSIVPVNSSGVTQVPSKQFRVYTQGSDPALQFYLDAFCQTRIDSFLLSSTIPSRNLYFSSGTPGSRMVSVSTYAYEDDAQVETILSSSITPSPTPNPSPSPVASTSSVIGISLDDVSDSVRGGEIAAIRALGKPIQSRVVFDGGVSASYYLKPLTELKAVSSIMGQVADSTDMKNYSPSSYQARTQSYMQTLKGVVDLWEIGNEVNGNWLGSGTFNKIKAAYSVVKANQAKAALTFFYMGEPNDPGNCIDAPGNDQFSWINTQFQLGLQPSQRDPATEAMRLGLDVVLVSWYPDGCSNIKPNWSLVFSRLAAIFPNSKVGFGEIGTAKPQYGSTYEKNLILEFYPMASRLSLPASFLGGYYWWYFAEEMVPYQTSALFPTLYQAIR